MNCEITIYLLKSFHHCMYVHNSDAFTNMNCITFFVRFCVNMCSAFLDHYFPDARFVVVSGGTDATIPRR